ncbi:hypothetical protein NEF87_002629 [Candidatus Lokiarchaeum ossiferum]|uniref:VWFA domain-containing protein n=1 Tax=Candidatus Lokiarchaeum ossiferum TaxID=2951803 RepID=A0ABY6HS61_9ARCH|nr:hypothetical protein NEF87_002629 [Candidatus Lokiarchaeum sp. B-35]
MKNPFSTKIIREKIIIYLDLSSKVISKKNLLKNINSFVIAKFESNPHHDFSIFYFKEGGEPVIQDGLISSKSVKQAIEIAYDERSNTSNYFENGLFFCLSGIASSFLAQAITFRIIVFSDLPSEKNTQYMDALMNLVETVRTFPTFIDIIRIGDERLYSDDVKLRIITTLTNGGLFYINSAKNLKEALAGLVHNKILPDLRSEGGQSISDQHKLYYMDLSLELNQPPIHQRLKLKCNLCEDGLCQYCNNSSDLLKTCPSCGIALHECCSALYSWNYNIGMKNIFRCPSCGSLIRLDEKTVYRVNGVEFLNEIGENTKEKTLEPEEIEESWKPESIQKPKPIKIPSSIGRQTSNHETKRKPLKTKMGLFGPRPVPSNRDVEFNPTIENKDDSLIKPEPQKKITVAELRLRREKRRESTKSQVVVCPVCSSYAKPGTVKCPKCGCPIRS